MAKVKDDQFWDRQGGGGVRCSSVGEDASKYHDPSTHSREHDGRSLASLLPTGNGLRGVIIPRSTSMGGSLGFDPHKPRLINIDPDIKGQSCVVDLSQITKEKMAEAFEEASRNPLTHTDMRLLASQTFHNLAVGYEPVGMSNTQGPIQLDRRSPLGDGTYVVPKSTLGGRQISEESRHIPLIEINNEATVSPSISPRRFNQPNPNLFNSNEVPVTDVIDQEIEEEQYVTPTKPLFQDQSMKRPMLKTAAPVKLKSMPAPKEAHKLVSPPNTKVIFETEGWGQFEANYHQVIKTDCLIVLVYDSRFKAGMKFWPPSADKVMAVHVDGQDAVYFVYSYGNRFTHDEYEYCILVIDQDATLEENI